MFKSQRAINFCISIKAAIVLFLSLILLPTQHSYSQASSGELGISVRLNDFESKDSSWSLVLNINITKLSDAQESKLTFVFNKKESHSSRLTLNPQDSISLNNATGKLVFLSQYDPNYKISNIFPFEANLSRNSLPPPLINITYDNRIYVMNLLFTGLGDDEYQVLASVANDTFSKSRPFFKENKVVFSHTPVTVSIRKPDILTRVKQIFFRDDSLLIYIIVGLISLLIASLRKKIEYYIDLSLEKLGSWGIRGLDERSFIKKYLRNTITNNKHLNLVGFNKVGINRPLLEDVFISLKVSNYDFDYSTINNSVTNNLAVEKQSGISFTSVLKRYERLVIYRGTWSWQNYCVKFCCTEMRST